jgi:hypothetical protein
MEQEQSLRASDRNRVSMRDGCRGILGNQNPCSTLKTLPCFDLSMNSSRFDAVSILDHLILGAAGLYQGIARVKEITAVAPVPGGSHPGAGTRNALWSLGNRRYLEIMSIDTGQKESSRMAVLIRNLTSPRLIAWAAATDNIYGAAQRALSAGCKIQGPDKGSRVKPAGGILKWQTVRIVSRFEDMIPFFIEWDQSVTHPAEDSPQGCALKDLMIEHPDAEELRNLLEQLGINASVSRGKSPLLKAVLTTPQGEVELS